jgi:hypothetical protein
LTHPLHGSGKSVKQTDGDTIVKELSKQGFIVEFPCSGGKFSWSKIGVSQLGEKLVEGKTTFKIRTRVEEEEKKKESKEADPLRGILLEIRKKIANKEEIGPYLVFGEAILVDLMTRKPTNLTELLEIEKLLPSRIAASGVIILNAIRGYQKMDPLNELDELEITNYKSKKSTVSIVKPVVEKVFDLDDDDDDDFWGDLNEEDITIGKIETRVVPEKPSFKIVQKTKKQFLNFDDYSFQSPE